MAVPGTESEDEPREPLEPSEAEAANVLPESIGRIEPSVIRRDLDSGETALFHPARASFMNLNPAGRWLWDRCTGRSTASDLVAGAVATFGWEPAAADGAVRAVLHEMIRNGFVARSTTDRLIARRGRPYSTTATRWVWQQRYEMLDVGIVFRTNDEHVAADLTRLFASFEVDTAVVVRDLVFSAVHYETDEHESGVYDLLRFEPEVDEARVIVSAGTRDEATMESLVAANSVAISRAEHYSIHAAALAVGDEVLVIPAHRNAGKSTLVAACMRHGFDYVSDEALTLRDDGTIVPYPKPLWLKEWSRDAARIADIAPLWDTDEFKDAIIDPADLGTVKALDEPRLRPERVVTLEIRPGPPELTPLSTGELVTALVTDFFDKAKRPRAVFERCLELGAALDGWKLSFSDPWDGAELLWHRFGAGR